MANEIIKVLEYIVHSPLFIGIAIFIGVIIAVVIVFQVFIFSKIVKSHKEMNERFRRW